MRRRRSVAPFLPSFYRFGHAQAQSQPSYPVNQSHRCNTILASYIIAKTRKKECLQDQVLIQALKLYIVQGIVDTLLSFNMAHRLNHRPLANINMDASTQIVYSTRH